MASLVEERTRHFYEWERRGRGWQSFPYPVRLEPPFAPFRVLSYTAPPVDDGRHHTALSRLLERFSGRSPEPPPAPVPETAEPDPEPHEDGDTLVELAIV